MAVALRERSIVGVHFHVWENLALFVVGCFGGYLCVYCKFFVEYFGGLVGFARCLGDLFGCGCKLWM
jgi:hypothetical protein